MNAQQIIQDICKDVGVTLNGPEAWDPTIHNDRFYAHVLARGSLGLGESYMRGWWDADDLFGFFQYAQEYAIDGPSMASNKSLLRL